MKEGKPSEAVMAAFKGAGQGEKEGKEEGRGIKARQGENGSSKVAESKQEAFCL